MAMQFAKAQRAAMPNYVDAAYKQSALDQQKRNADQLRLQARHQGTGSIASAVPETTWQGMANSVMGGGAGSAVPAATGAAMTPVATGMAAPVAASLTPVGTGMAAANALAPAAIASTAAPAAVAGGAGAAGGAGMMAGLASNPFGWGALGLMALNEFGLFD